MGTTNKHLILAGAVLVAGLGVTGAAVADGSADSTRPAVSAPSTNDGPNTTVEIQRGIVLEGTGAIGDTPVAVTIYENEQHGNSVQVVLGDPEEDRIGFVEQAERFVVDGVLRATVEVDGRTVEISGTVTESGRPTKVTAPVQDAGEQIVDKGTHTPLATDVTLTYDGSTVPLTFDSAFAYDLETRKVTLYGN